jgi:DHA1 family inner membrane transport protein
MRPGSWGSIFLIYFYIVLSGSSMGKIIPIVPDLAQAMNSSMQTAAWFISVVGLAALLLAPLGGELTDRLGDRKVLLIGVLASLLGTGGGILARNVRELMATRSLEGVGYICLALGGTAMMARTVQGPRQAMAMAIASTGIPFGIGIAEAFGGLAAGGANWRNVFWGSGIVLAMSLFGLLFVPGWKPTRSAGHVNASWVNVASKSGPLRLALGIGVSTIIMFGLGTLFPLFLENVHGLSPARANAFGIISFPSSIIGSVMVGWILTRFKNVAALIWFSLIMMTITGVVTFTPALGVDLSVVALVLFYIVSGMLTGIGMSRLPLVTPSPAATGVTTGLYMQGINLAILVAPPIIFLCYYSKQGQAAIMGLILACTILTLWLWAFDKKIAAAQA